MIFKKISVSYNSGMTCLKVLVDAVCYQYSLIFYGPFYCCCAINWRTSYQITKYNPLPKWSVSGRSEVDP